MSDTNHTGQGIDDAVSRSFRRKGKERQILDAIEVLNVRGERPTADEIRDEVNPFDDPEAFEAALVEISARGFAFEIEGRWRTTRRIPEGDA